MHALHDWEFEEPEAGNGEATLEWDLVEEAFERTARKAGGLEGGGVSVEAAVALVSRPGERCRGKYGPDDMRWTPLQKPFPKADCCWGSSC